jgi:hypothetical protein
MFDSGALRPGDYIAGAVDASFFRLLMSGDRDAMDRLSSAGTRVSVVAGERQHQDLRMVPLR